MKKISKKTQCDDCGYIFKHEEDEKNRLKVGKPNIIDKTLCGNCIGKNIKKHIMGEQI